MPNNYNVAHGESGKTNFFRVIYKTESGTRFKVDGDLVRTLEVEGRKDYVLDWIRGRLRKMENGQIKVIKDLSKERDWKQEEKIKRQLWEDINVNEYPQGIVVYDVYKQIQCEPNATICPQPLQTQTTSSIENKRLSPPPICKTS